MSIAGAVEPSRAASSGAAAGVWYGWVTVATRTKPIWSGVIPACSRAWRAACSAMSMTLSSSAAQCRLMMPERSRIHSSLESILSTISEFMTTRAGPVGADAR